MRGLAGAIVVAASAYIIYRAVTGLAQGGPSQIPPELRVPAAAAPRRGVPRGVTEQRRLFCMGKTAEAMRRATAQARAQGCAPLTTVLVGSHADWGMSFGGRIVCCYDILVVCKGGGEKRVRVCV